jgi:hypothetical protein
MKRYGEGGAGPENHKHHKISQSSGKNVTSSITKMDEPAASLFARRGATRITVRYWR